MSNRKKMLCRLHPDFHTPANAIVGKDFDAEEYIRNTKEANADSQIFFAKCHYGFAYYPTEVGTVHPGLQCDMLGEIARECRKQDICLVVYESLFLDSSAASLHPIWLTQNDPDNIKYTFEDKAYAPICVNSQYLDELFIPQTLEIIEKYNPDEFFLDTMCDFEPCYCENCRQKFGADIPRNNADPNWDRYVKWYNECYDDFFARITAAIKKANPDTIVTFNWKWSARIPQTPPADIKSLAGDLHPLASEASYNTRYWAGTGRTYEYMCGRFMHGLGDWTTNTLTTLKSVASAAVANGAGFYLIDRQLPDGKLEQRAWDTAREVFGFIQKKRQFLEGTVHAPEIAVLFSSDHIVGQELELFPDAKKRDEQIEVHRGISEILRLNGIHYTALNEENLVNRIDEYKLVIIPETENMRDELVARLLAYANAGGRLLLLNCKQEDLLKAAGADVVEYSDCEYSYVQDTNVSDASGSNTNDSDANVKNAKNMVEAPPFVVRGGAILAKHNENSAEYNAAYNKYPNIGEPLKIGDSRNHYGHGFAPFGGQTEYPAFVVNKTHNVGAAMLPFVRSYFRWHEPNIARYIVNRIKDMCPNLMVELSTKALVEMALLRQGDDLIINLVNHSGREYLAAYWCPIVEYMPVITDACIRLDVSLFNATGSNATGSNAKNASILRVENCDTGEIFDVKLNGENKGIFDVPEFDIMSSFRVKKAFA